jgi:Zn-dependent protease with chaperone function
MSSARSDTPILRGLLHIGQNGDAIPVVVTRYGDRIVVRTDDDIHTVSAKRLRRDAADTAQVTLFRTDRPEWRLIFRDLAPDSWVGDVRPRSRPAARRLAIAAVVLATIGAGSWASREKIIVAAAPLLPHSVTDEIGRTYMAQAGRACDDGPGNAALLRLTARLSPATLPEPLSVRVVDNAEVNAVALPGGHVALFRGLIEQARSPDEVAAALAHEIEHVAYQHPNQSILRASGPAVIARTLDSDIGKLADLTVLKKGDKAAEEEADAGAITLLGAANVSTRGAADFFDRQRSVGSIFDTSHPSDASRARRFAGAARWGTAPALKSADWQALRLICQA